jgi:hypothetical protein
MPRAEAKVLLINDIDDRRFSVGLVLIPSFRLLPLLLPLSFARPLPDNHA